MDASRVPRLIAAGWAGAAWRPLAHPPRRLWVACVVCGYSAINEDKALRGWQETVTTPRHYRCSECAR